MRETQCGYKAEMHNLRIIYYRYLNLSGSMKFLEIKNRVRNSTFNPDNVDRFCKGKLEGAMTEVEENPGMGVIEAKIKN